MIIKPIVTICALSLVSFQAFGNQKSVNNSGVKAGFLFSVGQSSFTSFDTTSALGKLGFSDITGVNESEKTDFSLGYRYPFHGSWSLDVHYIRQSNTNTPLSFSVGSLSEEAAAEASARALPKLSQGLNVASIYHKPIGNKFSVLMGVGAYIWKGERRVSLGDQTYVAEDKGISPMAQLGIGYQVMPKLGLQLDAQYFMMSDEPINRFSLGFVYNY